MKPQEFKVSLDLLKGSVISAVALVLLWVTPDQVNISREAEGINSRTFPYIIFGILLVCGIAMILRGVLSKGRGENVVFSRETVRAWGVPLLLLGLVGVYIFLMSLMGYVVSSVLAVAAVLSFLRCKKWHYYVICIAMAVVIYFIFTAAIKVQLPGFPF